MFVESCSSKLLTFYRFYSNVIFQIPKYSYGNIYNTIISLQDLLHSLKPTNYILGVTKKCHWLIIFKLYAQFIYFLLFLFCVECLFRSVWISIMKTHNSVLKKDVAFMQFNIEVFLPISYYMMKKFQTIIILSSIVGKLPGILEC